jgi:hypothetical protein
MAAMSVGSLKADIFMSFSSRAAFGGNDTVDWGQLGPCNQNVAPTFNATSAGGVNLTGSLASGHAQLTKERDGAGNGGCGFDGWFGNFAAGDNLLWTGSTGTGPVTFNFGSPLARIGFQIESAVAGNFVARIDAYNGATLLDSFSENGVSAYTADNSAIFLGLRDLSGSNVSSLVISLTSATNNNVANFALNQLSLDTLAPVPEPSIIGMFAFVFGIVALVYRKEMM